MLKNQKVKKTIKFNELIIKLYNIDSREIYEKPIANIEAFDKNGNLLWKVEKPSWHYWDMQIDEENNQLEADSGNGIIYIIDLSDGHIIRNFLRK